MLPHWSGIRMIQINRPCIRVYTDASGSKGIGGWYKSEAFSSRCPRRHRSKRIEWKEAYAVLFAFAKWGHLWTGHTVIVMSDNSTVVSALNSRSVHGQTIDVLQHILLAACFYDIDVIGEWISSQENWVADALSRFQLEKIANLFPQLVTSSSPLRRQSGAPMSALRKKLRIFFGMDLLPELGPASIQQSDDMNPSPNSEGFPHIRHPSKQSALSSLALFKKHRYLQLKPILQASKVIVSTSDFPSTSSRMTGLDGLSEAHGGSMVSLSPESANTLPKIFYTKITMHLSDTYDDTNLRAAFCTAFAGFLRMGEFTWISWTTTSHLTKLSRRSVEFTPNNNIILHLPSSKTDQFRLGTSIPIAASNDTTCPVAALRYLFTHYPWPPDAPLFFNSHNSFDYSWVLKQLSSLLLHAGINPSGYSGHSFRKGAANTASQVGITTTDIMKMGRWKSNAVDRYFSTQTSTAQLLSLSKQLHLQPGPQTSTSSLNSYQSLPGIHR